MTYKACLLATASLIVFGCNKTMSDVLPEAATAQNNGPTVSGTVAQLKSEQFLAGTTYKTTDYGTGSWKLDPIDDTSQENVGLIITNNFGQRLKRVYDGAVNAQWFGLKGDGSDETRTLQAAINASVGQTLMLPSGTFFTRQLTLISNIVITGVNAKLRMIQGPYDNIMLNLRNLSHVELSGIEIALNGIQGNIWDGTTAIELQNCSNIQIDKCFIHDNTYAAIRLIGGNNQIRINNNFIQNTDAGVNANNTNTNINIVSNTFMGGTSEGVTIYGYSAQNYPTNFLIDSNLILNKQSFGIDIGFARFGTITHNTVNGCYGGVTLHDAVSVGSDNYYTTDMTIKNNAFYNGTFGVIYVSDRTNVTNNVFNNLQQTGISVNNFNNTSVISTSITIAGNTMTATGLAGGGSAGIALNNLTSSTVTGNSITQCGTGSSSIRFNGNCNNIAINGNNCGNGMFQSPNTVYSNSISVTNNTLSQTYFPVTTPFYYQFNMVVEGNKYTGDTTYNTAPDANGSYGNINSFMVRSQYLLAAGVIRYIEPSWTGRMLTLYSTDWYTIEQGNDVVLKGGNVSTVTVPKNNSLTLRFDGHFWNEVSRTF